MKLRRHVAGKKVGGEGRNDGGRMERRRAGRRGVYIPRRALPAAFVGMFVLYQPRCQPCFFASETATFALLGRPKTGGEH